MTDTLAINSAAVGRAPSQGQTLRRLFLLLFLRGRSSRGIRKQTAPQSVGVKLGLAVLLYGLLGFMSLGLLNKPVFTLAAYLHAMTFAFLGLFVAASAGEVLFNNEEADILLHRPVKPRALLWAKVGVLLHVSLWLAASFNFIGFFVGAGAPDSNWTFLIAHAISTVLEAVFCTACVVLVYQLCLRWFGRERLEGLMTMAQVVMTIVAVVGGQLIPRMMDPGNQVLKLDAQARWLMFVPPAWFAGLDDAVAGQGARSSWMLAGAALGATAVVLWLAFGKLAGDYEAGLQLLGERAGRRKRGGAQRRWLDVLANHPPLSWWLRDPVARASFLLTAAYLARDRDTKLRMYPSMAPMLILPIMILLPTSRGGATLGGVGTAMAAGYLGIVPLMAMNLLQYSQQWQAADVFRAAPLLGPARICHGARRALLVLLTLPVVIAFGAAVWFIRHSTLDLLMLLPGLIALPVYALVPSALGGAVPLSRPTEEAKSATRGITMMLMMFGSLGVSGAAAAAWHYGWFSWFVLAEVLIAALLYFAMRRSLARREWESLE